MHWRGSAPFAETLEAFEELQRQGKIRYHGVSNLDRAEIAEWAALPGGDKLAADQVLYNLSRRGPEWDLIPWCRERRIPVMAYTPLGQGAMLRNPALVEVGRRHNASPARAALAWLLAQEQTIVIPKAATLEHVRDNRAALDLALTGEDFAALDRAFPPPEGRTALGML
ncbi:MAG TPA: aldo/keto reductase [Stellaceae bacterium]|nr:aldo/keto reductase [Stellaceae bacterium]